MGNKTAAEILTERLLAAYRRKRASDGGEGRAYVASEVYAAEHEIERLEKGGVEGAHEGTTADKSGSRAPEKLYRCKNSANLHAAVGVPCPDCELEPEKLNNAHYDAITCTNDRSVALAESSLSSPPPTKDDLSAPAPPAPLSTQPDTTTEKI